MSDEVATMSYIINFFNDMQALNSDYATFRNSLVRVYAKHIIQHEPELKSGKKTMSEVIAKIEEHERIAFLELVDLFKFRVTRTWIAAKALSKHIQSFGNKEIEIHYEKIIDAVAPDKHIAATYVYLINDAFVEGISKDLLLKASQAVEGMVSQGGQSAT